MTVQSGSPVPDVSEFTFPIHKHFLDQHQSARLRIYGDLAQGDTLKELLPTLDAD